MTALEIADRLDAFDRKIKAILDNRGQPLTAGGQGIAIAMVVTLNLPLFEEASTALRSLLKGNSDANG